MLNAAVNGDTDGRVCHTRNGNRGLGTAGPRAAGRVLAGRRTLEVLPQALSALKQTWSLLMASRSSLILQRSQGAVKRHCLMARAHHGGVQGHAKVTGVHRPLYPCLLKGTCTAPCELAVGQPPSSESCLKQAGFFVPHLRETQVMRELWI